MSFLQVFQSRLTPDQIGNLLDLEESLTGSLIFYMTFPDLAGVPGDRLPETRTPPEMLQRFGYESAAKDLTRVLTLCKKLSASLVE